MSLGYRVMVGGGWSALPIFFSGIVFSSSFRRFASPAEMLGINLFGAVLGGLLENAVMIGGSPTLKALALGNVCGVRGGPAYGWVPVQGSCSFCRVAQRLINTPGRVRPGQKREVQLVAPIEGHSSTSAAENYGYHQSVRSSSKELEGTRMKPLSLALQIACVLLFSGMGGCQDLPDGQIANRLEAYLKPFVETGNFTGTVLVARKGRVCCFATATVWQISSCRFQIRPRLASISPHSRKRLRLRLSFSCRSRDVSVLPTPCHALFRISLTVTGSH